MHKSVVPELRQRVSALVLRERGLWELMSGLCVPMAVGQPLTVMYHLTLELFLEYTFFLE